jgi:CBS-domain-containing membrane protein
MLTAADVMTTDVVTVDPDKPVRDIAELLYTRRISGVPVVDSDGSVIGIVSEGDLIGHAAIVGEHHRSWWLSLFADESVTARDYAKAHGRTARDVMTTNVITVEETKTLREIVETLHRHRINRVPVVRDGKLVGIVTRGDLLKALATPEREPPKSVDDRAIHEQLMRELRSQPWAHVLDVRVEDGVVHLYGTFQSDDERRALRIAAENVPGVKRVEDHLTPWSSAPIVHSGEG